MLAFHYAGKVGRRPTEDARATFYDILDELDVGYLPNSFEFSESYRALLPHEHRRDAAAARFVHTRFMDPALDLPVMLRNVNKYPGRVRTELLSNFTPAAVDKITGKLHELCSDLYSVEAPASVGAAFASFDRNADGTIACNELLAVLQHLDKATWTEARAKQLFGAMDMNHDGRVDYTEFVDFIFAAGTPSRSAAAVDQATREGAHDAVARVAEQREERGPRKDSKRSTASAQEACKRLSRGKSTFLEAERGPAAYVYAVRERPAPQERRRCRAPSTSVVSFGLGVLPQQGLPSEQEA